MQSAMKTDSQTSLSTGKRREMHILYGGLEGKGRMNDTGGATRIWENRSGKKEAQSREWLVGYQLTLANNTL